MTSTVHPRSALFDGEKAPAALSVCEHYAGSEKLILKALDLQRDRGPVFDVTCDCEDGAAAGQEEAHAAMVADIVASDHNPFGKIGVRIHDPVHPFWKRDVDVVVGRAAARLAYVTIPKPTEVAQVREVIAYVQAAADRAVPGRRIPVHVLVETHGALRDAFAIAALDGVEVLDFGLMDFVSAHRGVIPASAMRSPGQFEHNLLVRAKTEVVAAALAAGVVPAHNVCLNLKNPEVIGSDALRARRDFGFQRMWSIHPAQIAPIIDAMRPTLDEVEVAAEILVAAQDASWGPIQHEGELHDRATYRYFWGVLETANATGMAVPETARLRFFAQA